MGATLSVATLAASGRSSGSQDRGLDVGAVSSRNLARRRVVAETRSDAWPRRRSFRSFVGAFR